MTEKFDFNRGYIRQDKGSFTTIFIAFVGQFFNKNKNLAVGNSVILLTKFKQ
jgi:hypothetical protein